ncbi:MAG: hypothetical protein KC731_31040 [Myxococcales bacterium]|nr:hypothetical protein [Myxococcales bacterium]
MWRVVAASGLLALAACDGCEGPSPAPPAIPQVGSGTPDRPQLAPPTTATTELRGAATVVDAAGATVVSVTFDGGAVRIARGGAEQWGRVTSDGRARRYRDAAGNTIADVSLGGPVVVIRAPGGRVAWRFSVGQVVRIWAGEETGAPLHRIAEGRLYAGDRLLGEAIAEPEALVIRDAAGEERERVTVDLDGLATGAWALLLLDDMALPLRDVVLAELVATLSNDARRPPSRGDAAVPR